MTQLNLRTLSPDELDQLRREVLSEQERRRRLEETPEQVATLAAAFEKDGGDRSALVAAITERTES